ncbi:MAG: hypothetical protein O2954_05445 [bacterium]|nr:hypothetical protein [bacterium]
MINIGIMVAIIILASAVCKYVTCQTRSGIPNNAEQRLTDRIQELERRLTDIQEVMISLDEKLDRIHLQV